MTRANLFTLLGTQKALISNVQNNFLKLSTNAILDLSDITITTAMWVNNTYTSQFPTATKMAIVNNANIQSTDVFSGGTDDAESVKVLNRVLTENGRAIFFATTSPTTNIIYSNVFIRKINTGV